MKPRHLAGAAVLAAYVAIIATANWLTAHHGLWPVGLGLVATAGTYAAGTALVLRNAVQDTLGRATAAAAIVAGAGLSAWLAGGLRLALASGCAFLVAEGLDMAIYTPLRKRGWARAATSANIVGATVDTAVFMYLVIATHAIPHFTWTWHGFAGQWVGKLWITWATVGAVVVARLLMGVSRRAVLRHRLNRAGA